MEILCFGIRFFAALTAIFAKFGVKDINPNLATAIRTTVILFLTWGIVFATGTLKHVTGLSKNSIIFLIASGLATGLSWLFYFKALQAGDISRVAPIDKLSVALVVLFGICFLHEKITWQLCIGSCVLSPERFFCFRENKQTSVFSAPGKFILSANVKIAH